MESLEKSMGTLKISDDSLSNVYEAVRIDIGAILLAYETELMSIFEVEFAWKIMNMSTDFVLYTQFQQAFPNEGRLFQFMNQEIYRHVSSADLLHMMPLVDEYIEHTFMFFRAIGRM